jgi:hypothetical protein
VILKEKIIDFSTRQLFYFGHIFDEYFQTLFTMSMNNPRGKIKDQVNMFRP